jgi:hypothetical protein
MDDGEKRGKPKATVLFALDPFKKGVSEVDEIGQLTLEKIHAPLSNLSIFHREVSLSLSLSFSLSLFLSLSRSLSLSRFLSLSLSLSSYNISGS